MVGWRPTADLCKKVRSLVRHKPVLHCPSFGPDPCGVSYESAPQKTLRLYAVGCWIFTHFCPLSYPPVIIDESAATCIPSSGREEDNARRSCTLWSRCTMSLIWQETLSCSNCSSSELRYSRYTTVEQG